MLTESYDHQTQINEYFSKVKPVCCKLIKNPTCENCDEFMKQIVNADDSTISHLMEYVIFPIQFHLCKYITVEKETSTEIFIKLLQCLKRILSKTSIESINKFMEINFLLLQLILEKDKLEIKQYMNEDMKFAVVDNLLNLYNNLSDDIVAEIYDVKKKRNCNPQIVYICTQLARNEKLVKLRITALKCLLAVARVNRDSYIKIKDNTLKQNIKTNLATMFPGIISTCYNILTSDSMLHHSIIVYSVRVFSRITAIIFENEERESNMLNFVDKINKLTLSKYETSETETILSNCWYRMTSEKIALSCKCLLPLSNHSQWKVRLELIVAADLMLTTRSPFINSFSTTLLEILIILSRDSMEQVSLPAKTIFSNLLNQNSIQNKYILESLEENLISVLQSTNSALSSIDENVLLSYLNLLDGYLNVLKLDRIMKIMCHFQLLIETLIKVVRFEPSSLNSFDESKIQDLNEENCSSKYTISWKNTKHLVYNTEVVIKKVCATIAQNMEIENIAYYLLEIFENNLADRKEITYLINNIVLCEKCNYKEDEFNLMKLILRKYLDSNYWFIPSTSSTPVSLVYSNILQLCLLVDGIGRMALYMKKSFTPFLLFCLYPIIEKSGHANEYVRSIGLQALKNISEACGYSDVIQLVSDNTDYITHTIVLKLRNLKLNANIFDVLSVIITHCQSESMVVLCEIIQTLLKNDEILTDAYCEGFLNVYKMFLRKLRVWYAPISINDELSLNESDEKHFQFIITLDKYVNETKHNRESFTWTQRIKDSDIDFNDIFKSDYRENDFTDNTTILEENKSDDKLPNDNEEEYTEETETKTEIPIHIDLIVSIANKILHVLPKKNLMNKVVILEILMDALLILTNYENHLLPLVHKIWSPLESRLIYDCTNSLIMRRCFELLCIIAVTARDFIRSRSLKKVIPIINEFLIKSGTDSLLKDRKSVYRMSQQYKFQRILLSELGYLALYIDLQEKEIYSISTAVTPYLDIKQPKPLQESCINLFVTIGSQYYDLVWLYMMSIWPPNTLLEPPSSEFSIFKFERNENNKIYEKNVCTILQLLN